VPECGTLLRAPLWLIGLLLLAAIGVGIYAYYTTPLPLGLSAVIQTPGGAREAATSPAGSASASGAVSAGQSLALGALGVTAQSAQTGQVLTASSGPPGVFTVVTLVIQNSGNEPVTPQPPDFRLLDSQGREYAVDVEATRSVNTTAHQRVVFDASVPPGGRVETLLAFEAPVDATGLMLRVSLGYGEVALPR
jgi:hypothetical protein